MNSWVRTSRLSSPHLLAVDRIGLDDGEVGDVGEGAPGAAGGPSLDLDLADIAFGLVVCPGHGEVDDEP
jgi:hypothetical protein